MQTTKSTLCCNQLLAHERIPVILHSFMTYQHNLAKSFLKIHTRYVHCISFLYSTHLETIQFL